MGEFGRVPGAQAVLAAFLEGGAVSRTSRASGA
jgi:hypothetical protein